MKVICTNHIASAVVLTATSLLALTSGEASASTVVSNSWFVETDVNTEASHNLSSTREADADQDGEVDGVKTATSSSESSMNQSPGINSTAEATAIADLAAGTLKAGASALVNSTGSTQGAGAIGIANATMGDTLTFTGGMGTEAKIELGVDGTVNSDALAAGAFVGAFFGFQAEVAIYDGSFEGTSESWRCIAGETCGALSYDRYERIVAPGESIDSVTAINDMIDELLTASIVLSSNNQTLKVFGFLGVSATRVFDNVGLTDLDFTHTATFSVQTDSSVSYSSASQVFLTGSSTPVPPTPAVPLPAGLPLLIGGLGALGLVRRRRK